MGQVTVSVREVAGRDAAGKKKDTFFESWYSTQLILDPFSFASCLPFYHFASNVGPLAFFSP